MKLTVLLVLSFSLLMSANSQKTMTTPPKFSPSTSNDVNTQIQDVYHSSIPTPTSPKDTNQSHTNKQVQDIYHSSIPTPTSPPPEEDK